MRRCVGDDDSPEKIKRHEKKRSKEIRRRCCFFFARAHQPAANKKKVKLKAIDLFIKDHILTVRTCVLQIRKEDDQISIKINETKRHIMMHHFFTILIVLGVLVQQSRSIDVEVGLDGSTTRSMPAVPTRKLGTQGLEVPPIGLGKPIVPHHSPLPSLHSFFLMGTLSLDQDVWE